MWSWSRLRKPATSPRAWPDHRPHRQPPPLPSVPPAAPSSSPARSLLTLGVFALAAMIPPPDGRAQTAEGKPTSLDAVFKQGSEAYNRGDYDRSIVLFEDILKKAQPGPALEPIYFNIASAKLLKGDSAGAVEAFRAYLQLYPVGAQLNDARVGLTKALVAAKRMPEALAAINSLRGLRGHSGAQGIDNYTSVLDLTLGLADSLLAEKRTSEALDLILASPLRAEVLQRQKTRIAELDRLYKQSLAVSATFGADSSVAANRDALDIRLNNARQALKLVEAKTDFDIPRLLRQAQCYMELDQPWHATVVYNEILAHFPEAPDRTFALRGLIFAKQAVHQIPEARNLCRSFLDQFPSSPFAPEIAAVGGQLSTQLQDNARAVSFFGIAIAGSQGKQLERVIFQSGNARFSLRDWAGAREMFDRYVRDYPKGEWTDNAAYRSAITWFLNNADTERYAKSEKAIRAFIGKFPASSYLPDAYYRLAICKFAFQEYPGAIAACDDWEKRFPTDGLLPEVLSLKADVQKTQGNIDAALETYLRAASAASDNDVLAHALNEAGRILEQKRDWARLASVFATQIERAPDSKLALGWYYWVARAKARDGQTEDAWNFLADHIGPQLDNPDNQDVEKLLELMAQIRSRQRPSAGEAPTTESAPAESLVARLNLADPSPLVRARLGYYEARILTLRRKPAEAARIILGIGRDLPPDRLSAPLLSAAGESLRQNGDSTRAASFFDALISRFPRSDYRDCAYVGLGDLALERGDAVAALKLYDDAIQKAGAVHRQREATVGRARCLLSLGKLDEAAKLFEMIAGAKQWRGEATALSLYYLGEIAVKQGDRPKGIAFFQRVFVSQVRYPEWVAKAYLASGQAFEDLGKSVEAANTYREMLRNTRLADRPELSVARTRLQTLVPSSS